MKKAASLPPFAISAAAALLSIGINIMMSIWAGGMRERTVGFYAYAGITTVLCQCLPMLLFLFAKTGKPHENRCSAVKCCILTFAAILLCIALNLLVSSLSSAEADSRIVEIIPLSIAIFALLPGVTEEVLFRGFMLSSLKQYGDTAAVIISSVLFAAVHLNLPAAVYALFSGLILGYVRIRTGRLLPAVLIHTVVNLAAILITAYT